MDFEALKSTRDSLQKEVTAFEPFSTQFPLCTVLVTMVISRLDAVLRVAAESSEDEIDIDGDWINLVVDAFGLNLNDEASVMDFRTTVMNEFHGIMMSLQDDTSLILLFIQHVIQSLTTADESEPVGYDELEAVSDDESEPYEHQPGSGFKHHAMKSISKPDGIEERQKASHVGWSPPPLSRFGLENLEKCLTDAFDTAFAENPQGFEIDQVLELLKQNPSIKIDEEVMTVVLKIYNDVIHAMNKQSAQQVDNNAGKRLATEETKPPGSGFHYRAIMAIRNAATIRSRTSSVRYILSWSAPQMSRFGLENLERIITDTINSSVSENPQAVDLGQILERLGQNPSIKVDERVMEVVIEVYNNAIHAMNKKLAAENGTQSPNVSELACTYAALILHDAGIAITSEKIATLITAANMSVESYWPTLFAKLAEKMNIKDLIATAVGFGSSGGIPVAVAAPAGDIGEDSPAED